MAFCGYFLFFFSGCNNDEDEIYFSASQVERLLSGGETKTWAMISREENGVFVDLNNCLEPLSITFTKGETSLLNSYLVENNCLDLTPEEAIWDVVNESNALNADSLLFMINPMVINEGTEEEITLYDTIYSKVVRITSQSFTLEKILIEGQQTIEVIEEYNDSGIF